MPLLNKADLLARTDGVFFSSPPFIFDPVIGYRWRTGTTRVLSIKGGELIYDNRVQFNNWGHHCDYNYAPKKKRPGVFRFIVLGDSFTNGLCMARTWTQSLQELLNARPEHGREIEVYAFPVDGGGILNWHQVFMRQVLPTFEFDALILGDTVNDTGNRFITAHSTTKGCYIGFPEFEKRAKGQRDFKRVFKEMNRYYDVIPETVMDQMSRRARQCGPLPSVKPAKYLPPDEAAVLVKGRAGTDESLIAWYGDQRLGMLREMTDACHKRGARVMYYAMPRRTALLLHQKRGKPLRQQACAQALARTLGADYFDGYSAFAGVSARDVVDLCWLKHDGHWALPGATLFATGIAAWIVRNAVITPVSPRARV